MEVQALRSSPVLHAYTEHAPEPSNASEGAVAAPQEVSYQCSNAIHQGDSADERKGAGQPGLERPIGGRDGDWHGVGLCSNSRPSTSVGESWCPTEDIHPELNGINAADGKQQQHIQCNGTGTNSTHDGCHDLGQEEHSRGGDHFMDENVQLFNLAEENPDRP